MFLFGELWFHMIISAIEPPLWIFIIIFAIVMSLVLLAVEVLGAWAIWYIWKKVPTLTKKNEEQLASWLKDHNYTRCDKVKLTSFKTVDYSLGTNGDLAKTSEENHSAELTVLADGVKYKFTPNLENAVDLLDNYEISVQEQGFMIMTFKYEKARMLVYRQNPN